VTTGVIRYWAAAREAAGVESEACAAPTLAAALDGAVAARGGADAGGAPLARVFARCSYLIDGVPVGLRPRDQVDLPDGCRIEVLPPFAGG
jgi:molybdopterin converting factor small subunit